MRSIVRIAAVLVVALLATTVVVAAPPAEPSVTESLDTDTLQSAALVWEYLGCHQEYWTENCFDIYRDADGDLWYCDLCGTTYRANELFCSRVYGPLGFCQ